MAKVGATQVNSIDYAGRIVIEVYDWIGSEPGWHVPAWEEHGCSDLAGPFATVADAEKALAEH